MMALVPHMASTKPSTRAARARAAGSRSGTGGSAGARPPPTHRRIATSFARASPRTSIRLATLAAAMSRMSPTMRHQHRQRRRVTLPQHATRLVAAGTSRAGEKASGFALRDPVVLLLRHVLLERHVGGGHAPAPRTRRASAARRSACSSSVSRVSRNSLSSRTRTENGSVMSGRVPGTSPVNSGAVTPTIDTRVPVDDQRLPEHVGRAVETARPVVVADHGDHAAAGVAIALGGKAAAERHRHADHGVEIAADPQAVDALDPVGRRDLESVRC